MSRGEEFEGGAGEHYFHGTVTGRLKSIQPAAKHGRGMIFPSATDPRYAYATKDPEDAWNYAEKAWHATGKGTPRVYRVTGKGPVSKDPEWNPEGGHRGNLEGDVRSPHGFRVLNEEQMPAYMGKPGDWR